jgi:hypothetical protein
MPKMTALLNTVDPDGLLEYSVVFTDPFSQSYEREISGRDA